MPHTLNDSHFLSFKLLKPCCPWHLRPPSTAASSLPSRPAFLHPSFALLLSPDGNYLHKSVFALWFAPSHKWRLSLFNHGGFAGHVKAYNVAGPCFLHTTVTDLSLLERGELVLVRGVPPRLRLCGSEEASALDQALDSFTCQEVVKSPLVKGLRIFRVCPDRMLLCSHTASHHVDGEGGIVQIRDRLLTSLQGLTTAFVGLCFTMCGATNCWGKKCSMARESLWRFQHHSLICDQYITGSWSHRSQGEHRPGAAGVVESISSVCRTTTAATRACRQSQAEELCIVVVVVVVLLL